MKTNQNRKAKGWRQILAWVLAVSIVCSLGLTVFSVGSGKETKDSSALAQVTFDAAADAEKFDLYHSSTGGFAVQDGKLTPTGAAGEFKAIYKDGGRKIKSVSVELHPVGNDGPIFGGLYLNAANAGNAQDQINSLYVGIESHFTGWSDAINRIDLVTGNFPAWKELGRTISETGAGNNLFSGAKQPIKLQVDIQNNQLTITLSLVSNPSKKVTTSYVYQGAGDLSVGSVGIRSHHNNACYDNFTVEYGDNVTNQQDTVTVTETVAFSADRFTMYSSSTGGFKTADGKLIPDGAGGEFKAIYKKVNGAKIQEVSVDIYPGTSGINGGLYINAGNPSNAQDQIDALGIMVESNFSGWADAKNRTDLVTCSFPKWTELGRVISETGAGNNLFSGGVKKPVKLTVSISGNQLTATLSLLENESKYIKTTYLYQGAGDLSLGDVGIRSQFSNATYENLTVTYTAPKTAEVAPTDLVDFESADHSEKFHFYHSSNGGFAVQDGKLVPTGEAGEFKAIYKDTNASFSYVSVDIYPGEKGINGGLYLDVTDAADGVDQVNGLYIGIESDFPHGTEPYWEDAPNRLDLVVGKFPQWQELHRVVSETGIGNNLFTGGVKEPVNLSAKINGNELTVTVRLLSNPFRFVSFVYTYADGQDIALGNVGIRSGFSDASYDNFAVRYSEVEADKEPEPIEPEPTEPEPTIVPTDLVDFESADHSEKFNFYHSSNGGFALQDGKLVPTGEAGEFKAIYKDTNASFSYVSVDIYPGEKGINGGLYLDVTDAADPVDQVNGLYIGIESDFPHGTEPYWEDAPNRLDLVIGKFPRWQELHRVVSETGTGNNLFTGGVKEPIHLSVKLEGNELTVQVSLLNNTKKSISATYVYAEAEDMNLGNVGIRSGFSDASYDNFAVCYSQVEEDKDPDVVLPQFVPTEVLGFDTNADSERFYFYHSSQGGLTVQDGKLVPTGEEGEFKAIYRDGGNTIQAVSVDIYPGESGQINSGIYIGTSTVEDGVDRIKGLVVMVESNHSGWEDAVNRIDLVVGRFPIWKELHRYTSETGNGNALFAGTKEPLNLTVFLNGNEMTIRLSLLSNPQKFISTVYTYNGATELPAHNVGVRSPFNDGSFDNFAVSTLEGGGSADRTYSVVSARTGSAGSSGNSVTAASVSMSPDTGDYFRLEVAVMLMVISAVAIVALVWSKNKVKTQEVSQ